MGAYGSPELNPKQEQESRKEYSPYGSKYANPTISNNQRNKFKWWQIALMIMGGLFAFIMIMGVIGSIDNSDNPTDPTNGMPNSIAANSALSASDYKTLCLEFSYTDVARNPNNYIGKQAKFSGQVVQVQESGISVVLRANVTKGEYGIWTDAIYIEYTRKSDNESRVLENDLVTIYGELNGIKTYSAILGNEVSIPFLKAKYIDILSDSVDSETGNETLLGDITKEKYDKLETGMTYQQVKDIIGVDGNLLAEVGDKSDKYYSAIYSWNGTSPGSSANLTFVDNKLETKVQYGLN